MNTRVLPADMLENIEKRLLGALKCEVPILKQLGTHILNAGGKRLRPQLALTACGLVGCDEDPQLDVAAALELIHTATLIHDDIVDNSSHRRQRLSANALWSNATAVLSGDYIYSRAFEFLANTKNTRLLQYISGITNLMAQGELMQLTYNHNPVVTEAEYFKIIQHKTAYLFEACTKSASYLCSTDQELAALLARFGFAYGVAFQIRDDCLDYQGTSDTIGKPPGGDLRDGKPTLPYIHALQRIESDADKNVLIEAIRRPDANSENFISVRRLIEINGGFDYARRLLEEKRTRIANDIVLIRRLSAHPSYADILETFHNHLKLPD